MGAVPDVPGVSTAKVHKSGSGFSPGRLVNGSPGRSKTSSSCGMALKGAMSTPTALMLVNRGEGTWVWSVSKLVTLYMLEAWIGYVEVPK